MEWVHSGEWMLHCRFCGYDIKMSDVDHVEKRLESAWYIQEIIKLKSETISLKKGLRMCRDYDRSPTPRYGEKVNGHVAKRGTRFKTPREIAEEILR